MPFISGMYAQRLLSAECPSLLYMHDGLCIIYTHKGSGSRSARNGIESKEGKEHAPSRPLPPRASSPGHLTCQPKHQHDPGCLMMTPCLTLVAIPSSVSGVLFLFRDLALKISKPFHALGFQFAESFPEEGCRSRKVSVRAQQDGVLDAIRMTWDLALHGDVTYSTRYVLALLSGFGGEGRGAGKILGRLAHVVPVKAIIVYSDELSPWLSNAGF